MQKQIIEDWSIAGLVGELKDYQEIRYERDVSGNALYIGYNRQANAATTDLSWFIVKNTVAATFITRQQLPDAGPQYKYAWDSRATYFT